MFTTYNKSTPSVSYTAAMDLLADKLAIHARSTGRNADRAFDDALVHARDAAHAKVYSKLLSLCGREVALNSSEDIAQSVAARLFDGRVRARLIGILPSLATAPDRKRFFGMVISNSINDVSRISLKGPRFLSIESREKDEASGKLIGLVDKVADSGPIPSDRLELLDGLKRALLRSDAEWQESKAGEAVKDWSPAGELLGIYDESDRPGEDILPKRSRQRWQKRVKDDIGPHL